MKPLVYVYEDQINLLFSKFEVSEQVIEAKAYALDDDTIYHAFPTPQKIHPVGIVTPCKFVLVDNSKLLTPGESRIRQMVSDYVKNGTTLIIFLSIVSKKLEHRCFLVKGLEILEGETRFIPERSDLYTRSKGLLETDVLSKKAIGIVGLGSGGSPIAIEFAKAGIGKFVLIDFDRLELGNLSRHVCGVNDLGRLKTYAVRDLILQKNPHANITTLEVDVNEHREDCMQALSLMDLLICASDNDRSRFFLNEIALKYKIPAIFGRAITRAVGGDVLRVRPFQGPCYSCLYSQNIRREGSDDEEISQEKQAKGLFPDYTSEQDIKAVVQVGLSSDIAPISNFMVKLGLVELSRGLNSGIKSLEDDFVADFYIWVNRRENIYESWNKLEFNFTKPTILRWYGARITRDPNCMVCSST